jgi:hypothetical protein
MFLSKQHTDFKSLEDILSPFFPNVLTDIIGSYVMQRFFFVTNSLTEHKKSYYRVLFKNRVDSGYLIYTEKQLQQTFTQSLYIYEVHVPDKITLNPYYSRNELGIPYIQNYQVDEMVLSEPYNSKDINTYEKLNIIKPSHYKVNNNKGGIYKTIKQDNKEISFYICPILHKDRAIIVSDSGDWNIINRDELNLSEIFD